MLDDIICEVTPGATVIHITNQSFKRALESKPRSGLGRRFESFICADESPSVKNNTYGRCRVSK